MRAYSLPLTYMDVYVPISSTIQARSFIVDDPLYIIDASPYVIKVYPKMKSSGFIPPLSTLARNIL